MDSAPYEDAGIHRGQGVTLVRPGQAQARRPGMGNGANRPCGGRWKRLIICAFVVLGGCGGGGTPATAGPAPTAAMTAAAGPVITAASQTAVMNGTSGDSAGSLTTAHPASGAILYDVVQMTDRPEGGRSTFDLNAKGQLAFGELDETGQLVGKFYDGTNFHTVAILAGSQQSLPRIALNDVGQVAGQAVFGENVFHAFRWSGATGVVDLGVLAGADESLATDINDRGEVVGVVRRLDQSTPARAVLWRPGAGAIDLGVDGNVYPTLRNNNAGRVMGTTTGRNGFEQAFSWTKAGGPLLLRVPGINFSDARDINARGQIAGLLGRREFTGYLWTPGRSLVEFVGDGPVPFALNDNGTIVGVLQGLSRAFVWTRERGVANLGTFAGGEYSIAWDVNNRGQVVGEAGTLESARAFLWTRQEGLVDLNTRLRNPPPGLQLVSARQINGSGTIVAFTSNNLLVLLVPVAVGNQAPVLGPIRVSGSPRVDVPLAFSDCFTDVDVGDTHRAVWSWGDSTQDAGTINERDGAGTASGKHSYRAAGIYTVKLTLTDSSGKRSIVSRKVAVSGSGTFVAGAGWFVSLPGTYKADMNQSDLAAFAFLYNDASGEPLRAMLQFSVANLSFQSTRFDSQSVAGTQLLYRGSGIVNGKGDYRFEVAMVPAAKSGGETDRIRVRIWHIEPGTQAEVVDYDNKVDTNAVKDSIDGVALEKNTIMVE